MNEIQIQFKYNETIRSAIIDEPSTYEELEFEIKNELPKIIDIEFGLMYENHDGENVVLNKDPRSLRLAIMSSSVVPGTDLKRLKLLIFMGHSPSQGKGKDLDSPIKSPLKKRVCPDSKTLIISENSKPCSRTSKKCLSFGSRVGKACNDEAQRFEQSCPTTSRCYDHASSDIQTHISTPFERYVNKLEEQIRLKDNEIHGQEEKLSAFQERLNLAKSQQGDGNVCHNCHLRLNHTARKCMLDSCTSLFQCGEEKFHPTENVAKQYTMSLNKLKSEKEQMRKDLDGKKSASKKVTSIHNRIETDLLGENNTAYYQNGVKNWTLLRKHVYALQCYSKKYLNGKIPPKHELLETLEEALEEFSPIERAKQAKPRKHREFASKSLLEEHGVEFPRGPRPLSACNESLKNLNYSTSATNYSHLVPENEAEEEAQITFCIRKSLREKTTMPSTSTADHRALLHEDNEPTQSVECLSFTDTFNSDNSHNINVNETVVTSSEDNETAELLLSLSRLK